MAKGKSGAAKSGAKVTVKRGPIKTYTWAGADRYPLFLPSTRGSLYPYTMEDKLLHVEKNIEYTQLVLENEYTEVTLLPEIGGHLWGARDKVSGNDIFYRNRVLKPGLVAMRGAWWACGVEWNFPRGHNVSTVAQVDWEVLENEDGSVSAVVGDIDRISRMKWTVKVTVEPGRAGFRIDTVLYNPTAYPHRYMYWENCAMDASDGFQFTAPAKMAWTWGGVRSFPEDKGVDQSWYKVHPRAIDYFMLGEGQDYFGYYDHQKQFGAVHVADCDIMPGKKFFTWGTADHAKMWERNLTDDNGPYIELQCGLTYTQAENRFFPSMGAIRWDESWYPTGKLGPFVHANREGAVHLSSTLKEEAHPDSVELRVVMNRNHSKADVEVKVDGKKALEVKGTRFSAGKARSWKFPVGEKAKRLDVTVSEDGEELVRYSTEDWRKLRSVDTEGLKRNTNPPDTGSVKSHVEMAVARIKGLDYGEAAEHLDAALRKDAKYTPARYWKGYVHFNAFEFGKAVKELAKVGARSEHYVDALNLLGHSQLYLGKVKEAEEASAKLAARKEGARLGQVLGAKAAMVKGEYAEAARLLGKAARGKHLSPHVVVLYAAALRRAGKTAKAAEQARRSVEIDPVNHMGLNEVKIAGEDRGRERVMRGVEENYIELASYYEEVGLYAEAAEVLEDFRTHVAEGECGAILYFHLGHVNDKLGREAERDALWEKAATAQADYNFAHRREDLVALESAIAAGKGGGTAEYLVGTLLAWKYRYAEAKEHLAKGAKSMDGYAVALRNLGMLLAHAEGDYTGALRVFRKAIEAAKEDETLYLEAAEVAGKLGSLKKRVELLEAGTKALPGSQNVGKFLSQAYFFAGRYDDAIATLLERDYDHWENDRLTEEVYFKSMMAKGKSLLRGKEYAAAAEAFLGAIETPKTLKRGKGAFPRDAGQHYLAGIAYEALGDEEKALAHWKQGAAEEHYGWDGGVCEAGYYKGLCLSKLGKTREARAVWKMLSKGLERRWWGKAHDEFIKGLGRQGLKEWEKAVAHFEASLGEDKTDRNVKYHLGLAKKKRQAGA